MQEFHELCERIVVSDSGVTGKRKGAMFEEFARKLIIRELKLPESAIPIAPNTQMRKLVPGEVDYGDVDFAFMIGTTVIHLDMKSSCRKPAEFRGDCHAISDRLCRRRRVHSPRLHGIALRYNSARGNPS
jgi:hypothetical protein